MNVMWNKVQVLDEYYVKQSASTRWVLCEAKCKYYMNVMWSKVPVLGECYVKQSVSIRWMLCEVKCQY